MPFVMQFDRIRGCFDLLKDIDCMSLTRLLNQADSPSPFLQHPGPLIPLRPPVSGVTCICVESAL